MRRAFYVLSLLGVAWLTALQELRSAPLITEFLAVNQGGLADEDGESSDWIEIHNPDAQPVALEGWALTDVVTNLSEWKFPATNLPPGGYLVVFASGKDRRTPGLPLHTNFRLSKDGEFLALVSTDGQPVPPVFTPNYRPQFPNVSFGMPASSSTVLLDAQAPVQAWVPTDDHLGESWRLPEFVGSEWLQGNGGAGYETSPADYAGLIGVDLRAAMEGKNGSAFVRAPFQVTDPTQLHGLRLLIQYDDGFVAWLNGHEVARRYADDPLAWNSLANANHPDELAVIPEEIDLTSAQWLVPGPNVLAVQGLNVGLGSSDFLIRVALEADVASVEHSEVFFPQPTPGGPNRGGTVVLGPSIADVQHTPTQPKTNETVVVTARVDPTLASVASVTLIYRVRFGPEVSVVMLDDGQHADGAKNDHVFGAQIPAGLGAPGEMIRYRIEARDPDGHRSQLPLFFDPQDSEQYFGFVVEDPRITSALPVVHLFVENVGAAESFSGTRGAIAYQGEFYDNIGMRLHGQSSSGFPKKSLNLDFNRDHRFRYATNKTRVKDLKLLTNYGDKSKLHNTLAYEMIAASGSRGHFSFPVRVQRNGAFHAILDVVEDGDERWLARLGLSQDGALYKVYDALDSTGGSEKKTRQLEDRGDLQALIDGLAPSKSIASRGTYAYDNLDLPQVVSYFVGLALVSSQDHGHKNFYVHRDTTVSREWSIMPWDVDLTFGRNWTDSAGYFTDTLYTNNVLNFYNASQQGKPANRLYTLIFSHPEFRRMYLRRLRTVMDTLLQAPGTPPDQLFIESRIRYWLDQIDPPGVAQSDASLDQAKWPAWGVKRTARAEAQRIIDIYLPGRRNFLFNSPSATVGGERIPAAQATNVVVTLDDLEFNPVSGRQDEEYVRLTNSEPVAVDVSGWSLRGQIRHTFRPGTVIPAGKALYVTPSVVAFRARPVSPKAGENLFVQGNYEGQLSARGGRVELVDTSDRVVSTLVYPGAPTPLQRALRLSELMFHPAPPPTGSPFKDEDFEFVELKNLGSEPLNLLGAQLNEGVLFTFTNSATALLPAGGRGLLVKNRQAFESRYGTGLPILGEYFGSLDNSGESLRLQDAVGETIFEFRYRDTDFVLADGAGFSIEPISEGADLDLSSSWRLTSQLGGTPGRTSWFPPIEGFEVTPDTVRVRIRAEGGNRYQLEGQGSLSGSNWVPLTPSQSGAEGALLEFVVPLNPEAGTRFLRVAQP